MSYAPFNSKEKQPFDKYNGIELNKKSRFVNDEKKNFFCETPGYWQFEKKWDVVDAESNLIAAGVGTRAKTQIEMVQELHPNNYAIPIGNKIATATDEAFYYSAYYTGPGNGFGNLNVSNEIRFGDNSRSQTDGFKANKEAEVLERWQFIDNRFGREEHLVMDIPRGGNTTRTNQNDLNSSMVRLSEDKEFNFQY